MFYYSRGLTILCTLFSNPKSNLTAEFKNEKTHVKQMGYSKRWVYYLCYWVLCGLLQEVQLNRWVLLKNPSTHRIAHHY